ncbi:glutamate--tRNA ligase [Alphaproteobacteria bacterium HT1-32]|nr:glutamate--tRNA ligase [Alphaproteobacteria bacterium HT1-32]
MPVVTRFAPSPTGYLHIGGARTALFNWLFAQHHGGRYLLRIEDTDRKRSTQEAVDAIYDGLGWLGLQSDEPAVLQSDRLERHAEAARLLLEQGKAYHCYCSPEELAEMREAAKAEGRKRMYDGRWRDRDASEAPDGVAPVVRLKAPLEGETTIADLVQGDVTVSNEQMDDLILLRADGTPTYMLSVVVDDHDMGITHVIRGDDHLTNAFRQTQIYRAFGWDVPEFAHIPLIHGSDGAKLSKRHGALGVDAWRDMGFLPEAMKNYLLRLGWGHGDDEIIPTEKAIEWFDVDGIGKSAARFDTDKLASINAHYIREMDGASLAPLVEPFLCSRLEYSGLTDAQRSRLTAGIPSLRERSKTLIELAEQAEYLAREIPLPLTGKAAKLLTPEARSLLKELLDLLSDVQPWESEALETAVKGFMEARSLKLGAVAPPLRAALTGSTVSPAIYDVMEALGASETLARLRAAAEVNTD